MYICIYPDIIVLLRIHVYRERERVREVNHVLEDCAQTSDSMSKHVPKVSSRVRHAQRHTNHHIDNAVWTAGDIAPEWLCVSYVMQDSAAAKGPCP